MTAHVPPQDGSHADHLIGEVRFLTTPEVRFFRTTVSAPFDKLDDVLDPLLTELEDAKAVAGIGHLGPIVIRYFEVGEPQVFRMDAGVPVSDDVVAAGEAEIEVLPSIRCAALIFWGSLAHIGAAYGALNRAIADAGLKNRGEGREWHLHFEGDSSPHNIIMLQLEVVDV